MCATKLISMTRISATIHPSELCDKMLIAEHREIVRIPNAIKSGKAVIKDIPENFRLGAGHVKFFYDKIGYLFVRYIELYEECIARGFNVQNFDNAFSDIPDELFNGWVPDTRIVRPIIVERINERLKNMKTIRYKGVVVDYESFKLLC